MPTLEDFQNYMYDDDIDANDPDLEYHVTTYLRQFGYYPKPAPVLTEYKQNLINLLTRK